MMIPQKIIEKLKRNKKLEVMVYCAFIGLGLLLYFASERTVAADAAEKETQKQLDITQEQDLEQRLAEKLSGIRGAGKVSVMITYDTTGELVPAMSVDRQNTSSDSNGSITVSETESSQPATLSGTGGSEPLVLTQRQPTIRGVIVVAEGAADIAVQMDLQLAVETVLGIPPSAIEVFEMTQ